MMWYPSKWVSTKNEHTSWAREDAPIVGRNMVKLIKQLKENPIDWSK
jgi:hypothetical protein